ncbi:hypothetical protein [Bradyrhizobium sp. SZCCHNR1051]|uniref:hypothetical protein n=1 Tax=Bradyrhizobium sp. SZCCHNR1051 TaxID=3057355 RepID=UPI00291695BC|nr:hypothetical protein [Bradyrhizobium sp. SZCCHNR1051]
MAAMGAFCGFSDHRQDDIKSRALPPEICSMRNISQDAFRRIRLPFPPGEVRRELIGRLEASFTQADRLEAEAARARALLDRLEAAILTKAFKVELVPQDPNDEPASVLLERIRAQRAAAAPPNGKRGRRAPLSNDRLSF